MKIIQIVIYTGYECSGWQVVYFFVSLISPLVVALTTTGDDRIGKITCAFEEDVHTLNIKTVAVKSTLRYTQTNTLT